jgi:hypothetical protein
MDWLRCASIGAGPRIREDSVDLDNTPRIPLIAKAVKDEGIVQPFLKKKEQLARRLHQKCRFPGEIREACASLPS